MTTATDPKTGQQYELMGGRWVPVTQRSEPVNTQDDASKYAPDAGNPFNAAMIGAGDVFHNVGLNARDLWAHVTGNHADQASVEDDRQEAAQIRAQLHDTNPMAATIGGMLPGLATAPLAGAGMLGQLAASAGIGAMSSESGDFLRDAVMGAAFGGLGMGGQQVVGRVLAGRAAAAAQRGGGGLLNDAEQAVIDGAKRSGLAVTPGQTSGSKAMRDFESQLAVMPGAGAIFGEIQQANRQQVNRLAARAMGVEADNVGPEARAMAEMQLGQKFTAIGDALGTVNVAPVRRELEAMARDEATQLLPNGAAGRLKTIFEKGTRAREAAAPGAGDEATGQMLMSMRSEASGLMRQAFNNGDHEAGQVYLKAVDMIDGTLQKAAAKAGGPDLADAYRGARQQWNVLRAANHGGVSIDGNVQPAAMMRLLRGGDESGLFGRGDVAGLSTQTRGSGIIGQNPTGDLYDALRFVSSPIGRDSLPLTGARLGASLQLNGMPGVALQLAKRLALAPMARAYAGLSPQAAAVTNGVIQTLRQPAPQPAIVDMLRTGIGGALGAGG